MNLRRAIASLASLASFTLVANAQFVQVNLVSDGVIPALNVDRKLVNPWGIAFSPTGPIWVSNNGSGTSTVYDGMGLPYPPNDPLVVTLPPTTASAPTGLVYNGSGGFMITKDGRWGPSRFIFVSEDGSIAGWNPQIDPKKAITVVQNSSMMAKYKGAALAVAPAGGASMLYATNFKTGMVDVFDSRFAKIGSFTDPSIPRNFSPFGIQNVRGFLVVTYAKTDPDREDDAPGVGNGYVDLFTPFGRLIRRIASRGVLNSPWGVAAAPSTFGPFGGDLLIGNFGDGKIHAFTIAGKHAGVLRAADKTDGHAIGSGVVIPGLWGMAFGNGHLGAARNQLYFTAGPGEERHGLFGYVRSVDVPN